MNTEMKILTMFIFSGAYFYFMWSMSLLFYSRIFKHPLWRFFSIGLLSIPMLIIFTTSPNDTVEWWGYVGAFIGILIVELKCKTIITIYKDWDFP
jgi:hypothetical protein